MNHPSEVLEIGQRVRVKVLDVDRDRQRISLGLKQTQTDPWQRLMDECSQGDVVAGRITKVVTFGAFAEIVSGVEGLIHISELAEHHVENPREVVQQGQDVNVKIVEIDPERRRLSLSLRRVEPDEPVKAIDMGSPGTGRRARGAGPGAVGGGLRRHDAEPEAEAAERAGGRRARRGARGRRAGGGCRGRPEPRRAGAAAEAEPRPSRSRRGRGGRPKQSPRPKLSRGRCAEAEAEPEAEAAAEPGAPEGEGDSADE